MLIPLMGEETINRRVAILASEITVKVHDPCLWIILDGAFMFGADLARKVKGISDVKFLKVVRGYAVGEENKEPKVYSVEPPVFLTKYTHVLVDVITETGVTFEYILRSFAAPEVRKRIKTCTLIAKGHKYTPTFLGKRVETTGFLTGYGMGPHRHLPYVSILKRR